MNNSPRGQVKSPEQLNYVGNNSTYHEWTEGVTITPVKRTDSSVKEQRREALNTAKEKAKDDLRKILAKRGHNFESARKNEKLWKKVNAAYKKRATRYFQEINSNRQSNRKNTSSEIKKAIPDSNFPLLRKSISKIDDTSVTKDKELTSNKKVVLPNGLTAKPGVNIDNLSPKLIKILPKIVEAYEKSGTGFKPWISSGNDSKDKVDKHGNKIDRRAKTSAHYTNEAIDLSRFSADNTNKEMDIHHVKAIAKALTGSDGFKTREDGDENRRQYNWDTNGDGKRDFVVIIEHPGEDNQHMHIQIPKELRGK